MGHKHLHELLKEDQEPFQLKDFIADRRSQLKSTTTAAVAGKSSLNVRKQKPIVQSSSSSATARNFCINHVCLFSFQDSPDFRKSPFLDFPARELKSPCNNAAAVFLHIPARTAAMLLDAAVRVQKPKPKPGSKQIGLGLFGSLLRRLKDRRSKNVNGGCDVKRLSYPCDGGRPGGVESQEKSPEMEASCSSSRFEEIECLCSSDSSSPFRFSLQRSPAPLPARREPGFSSSVASPSRHFRQDKKNHEIEYPQEINRQKDEEKEQCSPVSVLDPLFDDDDEEGREEVATEEDGYAIECTYANVQRAKHQLLQKLQRFERLAGLDPIKLENHMLEQSCNEDDKSILACEEEEERVANGELFKDIVNHLGIAKIPRYMKKLVSDLIEEESKNEEHCTIVQSVCSRLHSWEMVELNTIDMMVETDFRSEGWKRCDEVTFRDVGIDIEVGIFEFLVEELGRELVDYSSNADFIK